MIHVFIMVIKNEKIQNFSVYEYQCILVVFQYFFSRPEDYVPLKIEHDVENEPSKG